jgi:hypothetical protein
VVGSSRVKMLKMNEMLFIFSHSEKLNPNFLLKGSVDAIFIEDQIIFWGSRRIKMIQTKFGFN